MSIALTGATGALGSLVVDALLNRGTPASAIVTIVRDADRAKALADLGVKVRVAAYGDVPALTAALDGVDRLLLISGGESSERVACMRPSLPRRRRLESVSSPTPRRRTPTTPSCWSPPTTPRPNT